MKVLATDTNNVQPSSFRIARPNGWKSYLFVLFHSEAEMLLAGKERRIRPSDCILYDRHTPQFYRPVAGATLVHDYLDFEPESAEDVALLESLPRDCVLSPLSASHLSDLLHTIKTEHRTSTSGNKALLLSALTTVFLCKLSDAAEQSGTESGARAYYDALYRMRLSIYNAPKEALTLAEMSNALSLSPSYLQAIYKRFFRVSLHEDLIRARLEQAKLYLRTTEMSVAEIATSCGYESCEHFIRQFKKRVGVPPNGFRRTRA